MTGLSVYHKLEFPQYKINYMIEHEHELPRDESVQPPRAFKIRIYKPRKTTGKYSI